MLAVPRAFEHSFLSAAAFSVYPFAVYFPGFT